MLQEPETAFLVVAAPEIDALREASYFVRRLDEDEMPLAGLVLNRSTEVLIPRLSAERALAAAEDLGTGDRGTGEGGAGEGSVPAALLRLHADRMRLAARDQVLSERFRASHPGVPIGRIPALPGDVHDLETLRRVASRLGS